MAALDSNATSLPDRPLIPLPDYPNAGALWSKLLWAGFFFLIVNLLDKLARLLANKWLLESLGFEKVFWTNFEQGAWLFVTAWIGFALAIGIPAYVHPVSKNARWKIAFTGATMGLQFGSWYCLEYLNFLLWDAEGGFHKTDPVFGEDIGFYIYQLGTYWAMWRWTMYGLLVGLFSSIACAYFTGRQHMDRKPRDMSRLMALVGIVSTWWTQIIVGLIFILLAVGIRLARYDLLVRDNKDSAIYNGAQYVDVVGLFSTLNYYHLSSFLCILIAPVLILLLRHLHVTAKGEGSAADWWEPVRRWSATAVLLIVIDLGFSLGVYIRYVIFVSPNEPVIQLEYIKRHIDGTREAFKVENLEIVEFRPKGPDDPLPDINKLLKSPSIKNASLWPGYTSYFERVIDLPHLQRILQTKTTMIYGPTQELFNQLEKYRPYYDFLGVDNVRYTVNGEKKMFVSSVRELPLGAYQPWLTEWANRLMLFTHGWGLVMAPTGEMNDQGMLNFSSGAIPIKAKWPEIATANPRVYYGEGSQQMGFTNGIGLKEFDYPSAQERVENVLPPDVKAGIYVNSLLKRLVLGWLSGSFFDILFSGMISDETRAHYLRVPHERLNAVAPFLYWDNNMHAFAADDRIVWLANGVAHADRYPYAEMWELGDKSDDRSINPNRLRPEPWHNYLEDAVKATIDAYTGQMTFYKIRNQPLIDAWAHVYPTLFVEGSKMPKPIRSQITYPVSMFHVQFDDVYVMYTMKNPMTFYNYEDPWDDGDEVVGSVLEGGKAITFSIEPYQWLAETGSGTPFPEAEERVQFMTSMVFTVEKAYNLRALVNVYQDGKDYGRIVVLQVPKGYYVIGPQQADAAIDQDPEVSRLFSWWNRKGAEVIRGHTTAMVIDNEVIYVEPTFLRSSQEPIPQLKAVGVVLRGEVGYAPTLEAALRQAVSKVAERQAGIRKSTVLPDIPEAKGGSGRGMPGRR
jgi:uncharacterized membrane protein (UPF0182 family)